MRLDSVAPVHDLAHPQRDLASGVTEGDRARFATFLGRDDVAPHNAMRVLKIVWQFT